MMPKPLAIILRRVEIEQDARVGDRDKTDPRGVPTHHVAQGGACIQFV